MLRSKKRVTSEVAGSLPPGQTTRRHLLTWMSAGGASLAGLAIAGRSALPARADAGGYLEGVWQSAFLLNNLPAGTIPNRLPTLFTPDGGVVMGFRPSSVSAADGSRTHTGAGVGQWVKTGSSQFTWAYAVYNWDDQNTLTGYSIFSVAITVNDTSDAFSGTFTGGPFDLNGNPLKSFDGTITGFRLLSVP
jgi:hypothetical protein